MTSSRSSHRPQGGRAGVWLLRVLLLAAFVGACGLGMDRMLRWLSYRQEHVVTRDAAVAARITDVGATIDGQVASLLVREGDPVQAGQVLARLYDAPQRARIVERRAELARAESSLRVERMAIDHEARRLEVELEGAAHEVEAAGANVEVAESYLPRWNNELERTESMVEKQALSLTRLDEVRASRDAAHATHAMRLGRLREAEVRRREAEVDLDGLCVLEANLQVLEDEVSIARAALERAEAELDATVVRAPGDGVVAALACGPHASVRVGQPILSLWMDEELWIDAWIDEEDLGAIEVGRDAYVSLDAYPERVLRGWVEAIVLRAPEATRERALASSASPILASRAKIQLRVGFRPEDEAVQALPGLSAVVGIEREPRGGARPGGPELATGPTAGAARGGPR